MRCVTRWITELDLKLRNRSTAPRSSAVLGRVQNEVRDGLGLRYERNLTRLHLDRLRSHSLCHEPLKIRIYRPIFRRDGVPAWFRPPCRLGGLPGEKSPVERPLHREERPCLRFRQVAREIT